MLKKLCFGIGILFLIFNKTPAESFASSVEIKVGDYLFLGTYLERPILWQCVDIDENGPLMYSVRGISCKAFDVGGENTVGSHLNSYSRRSKNGSNRWADSNIRAWLNSKGKVDYPCGNVPDEYDNYYANKTFFSWEDYREYERGLRGKDKVEEGFLTGFSQSELGFIKQVEISTPLYEQEFPDMTPYTRHVSDEEKELQQKIEKFCFRKKGREGRREEMD